MEDCKKINITCTKEQEIIIKNITANNKEITYTIKEINNSSIFGNILSVFSRLK